MDLLYNESYNPVKFHTHTSKYIHIIILLRWLPMQGDHRFLNVKDGYGRFLAKWYSPSQVWPQIMCHTHSWPQQWAPWKLCISAQKFIKPSSQIFLLYLAWLGSAICYEQKVKFINISFCLQQVTQNRCLFMMSSRMDFPEIISKYTYVTAQDWWKMKPAYLTECSNVGKPDMGFILLSLVPDLGCVWVLKFSRIGLIFGEGHTRIWACHEVTVICYR